MAQVKITETVLRDSHQSLVATRMTTEQMLPILEQMDKVGYHSLEAWGGATFDSCMRFLNEDPWERLRKIRAEVKNTKLQMLFRGQNMLGYRHYSDDVVQGCSLCETYVAVTKKDDGVFFPAYYSVYEVVSSIVPDKSHTSFPYILILPRTQSHLVAHADQKRIHAVTFYCK